jgi:hypothetical protein
LDNGPLEDKTSCNVDALEQVLRFSYIVWHLVEADIFRLQPGFCFSTMDISKKTPL